MPVDVKFPAPEPTNVFCVPKLWANAVPPRVITPDVGLVVMGRLRLPATSSLAAGVVVPIPTLPVFITVSTFDPVNADPLITSNRLPPTRRLFPKLENTVPSDDMLCTHTLPRPDVFCQVSGAPPDRARCKGPTGLVVPMPIFPVFITVSTFDPVNAEPLITSNRLPATRRLFPKLENTVPSDDML